MKKNAFTLIELLAVIVILAIISLIAAPIVINIINDSKNSSDEQSVELYLDTVEKTITKKQLKDPNFNPDKCEIQDNGDLECYRNNELIDTIQIEMKGKIPEDGVIKIENNKFIFKNILYNNKIYYESYAKLIQDNNSNGKPDIGDKYSYRVNKTDTFNFYVLSFNEDDTVNLIMDRNMCENGTPATESNTCLYQWNNNNSTFGPIVAMKKLYDSTKYWDNVNSMIINHVDERERYGKVETINEGIKITKKEVQESTTIEYELKKPLKARLPFLSEVTSQNVGCAIDYPYGTCPIWLIDNLGDTLDCDSCIEKYKDNNKISGITGFWLMESSSNTHAINVWNYGSVATAGTTNSYEIGIRPVITVPISDLE